MKNAMIVTKNYKYYPMTRYEANEYLVKNGIENFRCNEVKGILYFYIEK